MRYDGYTASILVDGSELVWLRQGLSAKVNRLPPERRVPLADVTGVVLKPATRLVNGRITVLLRGEQAPELKVGDAATHLGTVLFRYRDRDLFGELHRWLQHVADVNADTFPAEVLDSQAQLPLVAPSAAGAGIDPPVLAPDDVLPAEPVVDLVRAEPPVGLDDVPVGHEYWRVVAPPEAVAAAAEEVPDPLVGGSQPEKRRSEVSTLAGRFEMLNDLETMAARAREWRSEWAADGEEHARLGVRLPGDHPTQVARTEAWTAYLAMVEAARDRLLHALATGTAPDEAYFDWIDQYDARADAYFAADRAVGEARDEARDRVLDTMTAEQRHRYWWGDGPEPGSVAEWQEAELLAERLLHQLGFEDATRTPAGADKGLDVSSDVLAAQVKYTSTPVGRPVLQQLQGAAGGRIAVFFSRAGFTGAAREYADEVGMALFTLTLPVRVSAVNAAAERMVGQD
ncbi:MAG: restriction endonuclease [Nocardioides sp.]